MVDKLHVLGVIVGFAYLLFGVVMLNDTAALIDRGVETIAILDDYIYETPFRYPVVEFKDGSGSTVTARSIDDTRPTYHYHDKVPIIYDPVNPSENVRLNTYAALWLGPTFLAGAGAFVVILSLGLHWNKTGKLHAHRPPIEEARGRGADEPANMTQSATLSTRGSSLPGG